MPERPSPELLKEQVAAYAAERPAYATYADALKRVLEAACEAQLSEAVVTARAKELGSFAEKCVRRFDKYKDPVRQFTDLCGGRIIVQTLSQVADVRRFLEANFRVVETEDIGLRLGDKEFGYRDRHYIVQLDPAKAERIGFQPDEIAVIGDRRAELQIRTWTQHAWADTLHDRTYKAPLKPTAEVARTAALMAALMEDGDRNFDRLTNELDTLVETYADHHSREKVRDEIELNALILSHQPVEERAPFALKLARLYAVLGEHQQGADLLDRYRDTQGTVGDELRLELGAALCRQHRATPGDAEYQRGRQLIQNAANGFATEPEGEVWNRRRGDNLRARALSRLGWAYEPDLMHSADASRCHRQALELQPANPYYLSNVLGFELGGGARSDDLLRCLRPAILDALRVCESHAAQRIELPGAYFTAGRLRLLVGENEAAIEDYLRGAHHCLDAKNCAGCQMIQDEIAWLFRVHPRADLPEPFQLAADFLEFVKAAQDCAACKAKGLVKRLPPREALIPPVTVIAGGAASLGPETLVGLREPLTEALGGCTGTVISGGTTSGVAGLAGEIAESLKRRPKGRAFTLLGYRPALTEGMIADQRYDRPVIVGSGEFGARQILAYWNDILAADIPAQAVRVLGIGGGPVAALEYRMALAIGAKLGVVAVSGPFIGPTDAVKALLEDALWKTFTNLLPLPFDAATLRAFLHPEETAVKLEPLEPMARALHEKYLRQSQTKIPPSLRQWEQLPDDFRRANFAQAAYAVEILRQVGFQVRPDTGDSRAIRSFEGPEYRDLVEQMAELEHGRWNIERLMSGWRPGKPRDDEKRVNPCITPWSDDETLTPAVKNFDREAVRLFPVLLAGAGLEIVPADPGESVSRPPA